MLTFRLIACLDVKDGRVVKGVKFSNLRDSGDPAERAACYDAQGADEIVMLDVSATPEGRATAADTVARIRERIQIPLSVGGGIRRVEDAARLLEQGADKICVNSAAVQRPELIDELAARFGSQCVVVAIDARRRVDATPGYEILVRSGKQAKPLCPQAWAEQAVSRGAGEILLTAWDRDGTGLGYDEALLRELSSKVRVPVIASGGASCSEHLVRAQKSGAHAALVASLLHDDRTTVEKLKRDLADAGIAVRI